MGATFLQSAVNAALAFSANAAGDEFQQYRPNGVAAPIVTENLLGTVLAWPTTDPTLKTPKQSVDGKPDWYAALDPTSVLTGDYLVGTLYATAATFFVQAIERFNAPHLIRCNRTIGIARMPNTVTPGGSGQYAGDTDETAVISGWPASILSLGSKGAPNAMQLPNDSKMGSVSILLPASVPVSIFANDRVTDDLGNSYALSAAELSPLGWRLTADLWKQG